LRPFSTSGGVKARRSFCVTFSSVNEMFPEGISSSDHGEMMKPNADGSVEPEGKTNMQSITTNLTTTAALRTSESVINISMRWIHHIDRQKRWIA